MFFDGVDKLHGLSKSIVSDRDTIFTSLFWKELFKQQGCKLIFNTAYHQQLDGQSEIVRLLIRPWRLISDAFVGINLITAANG